MSAPTLETNAGADTLRILGGTSGDPVTWNDVWDWDDGGGSSGGDGDVPKDGGGTVKVNTFITETIADAVYLVLASKIMWYGDGSTPSYFRSTQEQINFESGAYDTVKNSATKDMIGSCFRYSDPPAFSTYADASSIWDVRECSLIFKDGFSNDSFRHSGTWKTSIIQGNDSLAGSRSLYFYNNALIMDRLIFRGFNYAMTIFTDFNTNPTDISIERSLGGLRSQTPGGKFINLIFRSNVSFQLVTFGSTSTLEAVDSVGTISSVVISTEGGLIYEQYTFNLHVRDKDGVNLEGVSVVGENNVGGAFGVNTGADGKIAEQTLNYKSWTGTDETLLEYSPYTFTISKTNYETLIINNITMDEKKDWELELLPALSVADVTEGTVFGENKTGTFVRNAITGAIVTGQATAGIVIGQDTVGTVIGE